MVGPTWQFFRNTKTNLTKDSAVPKRQNSLVIECIHFGGYERVDLLL